MPNARRRLDWLKWFPADFLNSPSVLAMSHAERGAYAVMLMRAWMERDCGLPNDDLLLARLLGMSPDEWSQVSQVVRKQFFLRHGRLHNKRLDDERRQALEAAKKIRNARAARAGGGSEETRGEEKREEKREEERRGEKERDHITGQQMQPANAGAFAGQEGSRGGPSSARTSFLSNTLPPWMFTIWNGVNSSVLAVSGSREIKQVLDLIQDCDENTFLVAVAWYLYVNDDPPKYHTAPVVRAVECTGKSDKKWIDKAQDEGAITQFPVLAFISTCSSYVAAAKELIRKNDKYTLDRVRKALPEESAHE